ncbi:MAG: YfhO family protein, partial [Planctomycetota bacterium]|nr:YfhO family protein [Planctomycetota bacterium]
TDKSRKRELLRRRLDPQPKAVERGWSLVSADLSSWNGQQVTLTFETDGGSEGAAAAAWACWAAPTIVTDRGEPPAAAPAGTRPLNREIIEQNMLKLFPSFMPAGVAVDGQTRGTIFMEPGNRARLAVKLSPNETFLRFAVQVDPQAWSLGVGDGTNFTVTVRDAAGDTQVYARYMDPKHNESDRRWADETVDLSRWRGQQITLFFAVDGGPAGDVRADWAHWANIELSAQRTGPPAPQPADYDVVYTGEVVVYRNNRAYPRAFVVHNVELARNVDEALALLSRPGFDPARTAIVDGATPQGWNSALLGKTLRSPPTPAQVVERRANSMKIKATLDRPGVLVVSDSYFPGWQASVDGAAAPVWPVDVALRGVYLEPGAHEVLLYYMPWRFKLGAAISVCTLLGLAGWVLWRKRKARPA